MMRKRMAILGFLTALGGTSARAQQPPSLDGPQHVFQDPLVEQLSGDWSMVGAVRGRPAADRLHGDWVLNHQFLRLEMRDVAEPPAYQATVYIGYDNTSERYVAHWLDSTGARFCETLGFGVRVGNEVRLVFEYPDGPFHTTFTLDPGTRSWAVLMQDRGPDGAWREFAHYALRRP
jgi:hypothetical protein